MAPFNPEKFETKLAITDAAVDLYVSQDGSFSLKQVASETDLTVAEIFDYFPNKRAILQYYYSSLLIRYRLMIDEIDDYESFLLEEKLSNFIYAMFDLMGEQPEFVGQTFSSLVVNPYKKTGFEKQVESLLRSMFENDKRIPASRTLLLNDYLYRLLRKKYLYLVQFWIHDDSEDRELSMALTDKSTSFLQELFYSAVLDRGFDLAGFMARNNILFRNNRLLRKLFDKVEIKTQDNSE